MSFDRIGESLTRRAASRTSRRSFLGVLGGGLVGLGLLGRPGRARAAPQNLVFVNNSGRTVWVGALGNPGKGQPAAGGFALANGQTVSHTVAGDWAGRVWGRTGCVFDGAGNGRCETGDCGNRLLCNGNGGEPPASLAEFTLGNGTASDFYDVSFVDGSNLPVTIDPIGGVTDPNDRYRCTRAGCTVDLNPTCPTELRYRNAAGQTVGCMSACLAFNTDQYCCRGAHDRPETCRSTDWPVNYPAYFKSRCPDAYSYAYDDQLSTFTCRDVGYRITFHPVGGSSDTQAPTVPGGLRGTGVTSTSVSLAWNASTDNVGVTGYDVHGGPSVVPVTGLSATVGGLTPSTAYTFTVRARDAAGNTSGPSAAVQVTTAPGSGGFDARSTIQAEAYSAQSGTITEPTTDIGGGQNIGGVANGDWLRFDGVRFGTSPCTQFLARVASGAGTGVSGLVEVRLGSRSNPPIGSFALANTGGWQSWRTVPANMAATTGTHTVFLTFASGQPASFVNLNWFTFAS
ncbi:MAG TPA: thaumatin family protein [Pseudonocardiaceae bacterium]